MSRQDLKDITLPVLSFTQGLEKRLPSCPPFSFHVFLLNLLMHLPTHVSSLFPVTPSAPHLPHSTILSVSSSSPIFPWFYHSVLLIPTASPCPQHPSHFLLLPLASLLFADRNPAECFPTTCSSDRCCKLHVGCYVRRARGNYDGI